MKPWTLVVLPVLALAGCTVNLPSDAPAAPMSVIEARQTIHGLADPKGNYFIKVDGVSARQGRNPRPVLSHDAVHFGNVDIPFRDIGAMSVYYEQAGSMQDMSIRLTTPGHPHTVAISQQGNMPHVDERRLASALLVLKQGAEKYFSAQTAFEQAAASYLAAEPKPPLPESVRRYQIQAEEAVRNQQFLRAAETYAAALDEVPAWPQGHFNFALVLESLDDYELAIEEMQRYLALVPDASNARAAQDMIYRWQTRLPDSAGY